MTLASVRFFDEIKDYVGFGATDAALLAALHPRLAGHFERFAEHFYQVITLHPRAATLLEGPAQVARLQGSLVDWMSTGLLGPHDDAFYEKRSRIGRVHVRIGLPQEFMFTAMNVLRLDYREVILEASWTGDAKAVCAAVDKLLDLELAIMLRHYQLDSEIRVVRRERRVQTDKLSAMRTLTAGLAHEVRNPLNAAKLQVELLDRRLRRQVSIDPRLLESIKLVHHEIERLTGLVREFLDFARPAQLAGTDQDLVAIVRQVVELERADADARRIVLDVVEPGTPVVVWIDGGKIHQVVLNLLRNAMDAVPPAGRVVVAVASSASGGVVRVRDNGHGIPAEILPRIWEPFFSTKEGGTGLGMSIVHSLLDLHHAEIDVTTSPAGTEFEVRFKRHPELEASEVV